MLEFLSRPLGPVPRPNLSSACCTLQTNIALGGNLSYVSVLKDGHGSVNIPAPEWLRCGLDAGCLPESLTRSEPGWILCRLQHTAFTPASPSHPTSPLRRWFPGIIFYQLGVKALPKGPLQNQDLNCTFFSQWSAYVDARVGHTW